MKKKLSIIVATMLVVMSILAICLVGCGPKMSNDMKDAFKDADVQKASDVIKVMNDAVDKENLTLDVVVKEGDTTINQTIALAGNTVSQKQGEMEMVLAFDGTSKMDQYMNKGGTWNKGTVDVTKEEFNAFGKDQAKEMLDTENLGKANLTYNKDNKNFTGKYKAENATEDTNVTLTVNEASIVIKLVEGEKETTLTLSKLGTTAVTVPTVA